MGGIFSSLELASWIKICWKIREKNFLLNLQGWISLKCKCIYFTLNCSSNISGFGRKEYNSQEEAKFTNPYDQGCVKLCTV